MTLSRVVIGGAAGVGAGLKKRQTEKGGVKERAGIKSGP